MLVFTHSEDATKVQRGEVRSVQRKTGNSAIMGSKGKTTPLGRVKK